MSSTTAFLDDRGLIDRAADLPEASRDAVMLRIPSAMRNAPRSSFEGLREVTSEALAAEVAHAIVDRLLAHGDRPFDAEHVDFDAISAATACHSFQLTGGRHREAFAQLNRAARQHGLLLSSPLPVPRTTSPTPSVAAPIPSAGRTVPSREPEAESSPAASPDPEATRTESGSPGAGRKPTASVVSAEGGPRRHSSIFEFMTAKGWALEERVLQNLSRIVARHVEGTKLSQDEVDDIVAARDASREGKPKTYEVRNGTAIIPVNGLIAKHASSVNGVSQPRGTSTQTVAGMLQQALADEGVQKILLAVDSPGGSVDGVQALADTIFAARGKKPITALADSTMASAAYWLASQADEIVATSDATVGSIGIFTVLPDYSRAAKNEGVDVHVVRSGKHKGAGVVGAPISSDQVAAIQREIDAYAELFVGSVARGRGLSSAAVGRLATGESWVGRHAVEAGLADRIGTLESLLAGGRA